MEIRTHCLDADTAIALHVNGLARLRCALGRKRRRRSQRECNDHHRTRRYRWAGWLEGCLALPKHDRTRSKLAGWIELPARGERMSGVRSVAGRGLCGAIILT